MKLLLVRHGDPDYVHDSLTEKGWKEAEYLSEELTKLPIRDFYVSPLGRAKDTASCTLQKLNREAVECDWLREFAPRRLAPGDRYVVWDIRPADWTSEAKHYDPDQWMYSERLSDWAVQEEYERVTGKFDGLLASYGYVRDGKLYRVEKSNSDTICLFCHFGVSCVLLAHLLHVSPMVLWHGFCAAPSSVTSVVTEEREEGIASFRVNRFGDISHLYVHGEEPSFAARFCECYSNQEERHD